MVFKCDLSQGMIHEKLVNYKEYGFDNLKWLAHNN
jgi:hypothetical protein